MYIATTAMNLGAGSDSGLVRRVKTREPTAESSSGGGAGSRDGSKSDDDQEDYVDNDSKETRLTLMEEVLLLGLKEKEVCGFLDRTEIIMS